MISSFGIRMLVYPASANLLALMSELCFNAGIICTDFAGSQTGRFNSASSVAFMVLPSSMWNILLDILAVLLNGSQVVPQLDVAPESYTAKRISPF